MKSKVLNPHPERTIIAVLDEGEEASDALHRLALGHNLHSARLTAIGALSRLVLGYFDVETRKYREIEINEQVEVLSLIGNVALHGAARKVHAHVVVGKSDGTAHGGHLMAGWVRPTLEVMIVETPGYLQRSMDEKTGLPLLRPDAE